MQHKSGEKLALHPQVVSLQLYNSERLLFLSSLCFVSFVLCEIKATRLVSYFLSILLSKLAICTYK